MPTQKTRQSKKRAHSDAFHLNENGGANLKRIKTEKDLMHYIVALREEFNQKLDDAISLYKPNFKDQTVQQAVQRAEKLDQSVAQVLKNNQKVMKKVKQKGGLIKTEKHIKSSLKSDTESDLDQDSDEQILQAYNDIVEVKPNSMKISINKKQAIKGSRQVILNHIRSNTTLFKKFSDAQLLFITDPKCIVQIKEYQPQEKVNFLLKHAIFKNFEGTFSLSTLQKIKQTFAKYDSEGDTNKPQETQQSQKSQKSQKGSKTPQKYPKLNKMMKNSLQSTPSKGYGTDRIRLLETMRKDHPGRWNQFSNQQLLFMTDKETLVQINGYTLKQKCEWYKAQPLFSDSQNNFNNSTLFTIYRYFKIQTSSTQQKSNQKQTKDTTLSQELMNEAKENSGDDEIALDLQNQQNNN